MKRRLNFLTLCLIGPLLLLAGLLRLPAAAQPAGQSDPQDTRLDPALREALATAPAGSRLPIIVHLHHQANLELAGLPAEPVARRLEVVRRLREAAASSQVPLLSLMERWHEAGQASDPRPLWIINAVALSATVEAIQDAAGRPEVSLVALDAARPYLPAEEAPRAAGLPLAGLWNIERIGALHASAGLGVNGQGATVAILDTGVDWQHPALQANYRGNQGGLPYHPGNWYDAVAPANGTPLDPNGHGTHVAGTAVGGLGIGVAPGAHWIAVRAFDQFGIGYDSAIHAAFQWLLAPNGNPALAPDVVNNSWGGPTSLLTFQGDVAALHAAGIMPVFAAGNGGPAAGSVASPASYPGALAIGASDPSERLTWFSARGPSPLTSEIKPVVVAPGGGILSSLPGGGYGYANGTSMAAPHASGALALLLSANSNLTRPEATAILTATARPIGLGHPNFSAGWGRLDAYRAVAGQVAHGLLDISVTGRGQGLPGITVTVTTPAGSMLSYRTGPDGRFQAPLLPGSYDLQVAAFGFYPAGQIGVPVAIGAGTSQEITLSPLPSGVVTGRLLAAGSGEPLAGRIVVPGTPLTISSSADGRFALRLPFGEFQLVAEAAGRRLERAAVTVAADHSVERDFWLLPGPTILLVDSGQWYYRSAAAYYARALSASDYTFDLWPVGDPFNDLPSAADLAAYDVVLWSAPEDAPGYLGAGAALIEYLENGGSLLASGQHLASLDWHNPPSWWAWAMDAALIGGAAAPYALEGEPASIYDGLSVSLNGAGSAANQHQPDQSEARAGSLSQVALRYADGRGAALQAGLCRDFRAVYLGFGLEGVTGAMAQTEVLNRAMDYFASPRLASGARFESQPVDDFAISPSTLVYTVTLRNLSEEMTDTFHLALDGATWPAELGRPRLILGPCETGATAITLTVPANLPASVAHTLELVAASTLNPDLSVRFPLQHRTPGHVLLVDDDRWYDQQAVFRAALDSLALPYDVWDIGTDGSGRGSPPLALLNEYDIVLWFTGYDWFMPITTGERAALEEYLAQGGRLFLNSQDYLYYHRHDTLTSRYLGVLDFAESISPTEIYAGDQGALWPELGGPLALTYSPYQNFSDGLIPTGDSRVALWGNQGMAAAVATAGDGWRTLFWAFPFETLPPQARPAAMNQVIGWLSDLGDSTFEVGRRSASPGATLAYTITLRNVAGHANQVAVTNTLPAGLILLPETVTGGADYDLATGRLTWAGLLSPGGQHQVTYLAQADAALPPGAALDNRLTLFYERRHLAFERVATTWLGAPDLQRSSLSLTGGYEVGSPVTYTLLLRNDGYNLGSLAAISVGLRLPDPLWPLTHTLSASGGTAALDGHRLQWQGGLLPGQSVTVTIALTSSLSTGGYWLPAAAVIDDGVTQPLVRHNTYLLVPFRRYFPLILR